MSLLKKDLTSTNIVMKMRWKKKTAVLAKKSKKLMNLTSIISINPTSRPAIKPAVVIRASPHQKKTPKDLRMKPAAIFKSVMASSNSNMTQTYEKVPKKK